MHQPHVLIITDDATFASSLVARWQATRRLPVLTQASSDIGEAAALDGYQLILIGPVRPGALEPLVRGIERNGTAFCLCMDVSDIRSLSHPPENSGADLVAIPLQDGWLDILVPLASEILARVDAESRTYQAELAAAARRAESALGRSLLETSHVVNDALTSLLGNADLLLQAPEPFSAQSRDQIRTIRAMALRLNELMQHFSSLAQEVGTVEKASQTETSSPVSLRFSRGVLT